MIIQIRLKNGQVARVYENIALNEDQRVYLRDVQEILSIQGLDLKELEVKLWRGNIVADALVDHSYFGPKLSLHVYSMFSRVLVDVKGWQAYREEPKTVGIARFFSKKWAESLEQRALREKGEELVSLARRYDLESVQRDNVVSMEQHMWRTVAADRTFEQIQRADQKSVQRAKSFLQEVVNYSGDQNEF